MFKIRQASLDDVENLVQLRLALLREVENPESDMPTDGLAEAIEQYITEKITTGEFIAWVAEADQQIVGTIGSVFFERPPYSGNLLGLEAYLMNIYVIPEWRGKGIASTLVKEAVDFIQQTGAKRVWLHASEAGKRLYEKAGFVATTSEMELIWS